MTIFKSQVSFLKIGQTIGGLTATSLQLCKSNHTWTLIQNKMTSLLQAQVPPTAYVGSGFLMGSMPQHRMDLAEGINGVAI